jgi:putative transposase
MMFPLVGDLAVDRIPVAVTCRLLGFSKQASLPMEGQRVSQRDWDDAHLINAAVDIDHDDPEFGYRFIADVLPGRGITASRNRVSRLCSQQRIYSVHANKRGQAAGPARRSTTISSPATSALRRRPAVADRHHRAPHRAGQALPVPAEVVKPTVGVTPCVANHANMAGIAVTTSVAATNVARRRCVWSSPPR